MNKLSIAYFLFYLFVGLYMANDVQGQKIFEKKTDIKQLFLDPPDEAKPWVYWYWMRSAVTKEGISADLKAMQEQGIGGAYLMTIRKTPDTPYILPPAAPLTPEWWELVRFAMAEANRLGVKLGMTSCDGWALAGGPWITPELSMQKVVWAKTYTKGNGIFNETLKQPETYKGYYKDIAVYAYPSLEGSDLSSQTIVPKVTSSIKNETFQLLVKSGNKEDFNSTENCWIQMEFPKPFTCRSILIKTNRTNYQAQRLIVEVSDNGKEFKSLVRLEAPRHGWQDRLNVTHTIQSVSAKYFRFVYDPEGSEPGSEDLDFAKFKPELKLCGIELSPEPKIHQYEGKNGEIWRIGKRSTKAQLPDELCIPKDKLINISDKLNADGRLIWDVPAGDWTIIRMGHTSTGYENAHAGTASGLECDKFSPAIAKLQFDSWFGEALSIGGLDAESPALKVFHVDSWECGSQNWSSEFALEFKNRRGYDLINYLPVMAGVPLESADISEKVLSDVRQTISELTTDNFFGELQKLAHEKNCIFSAECVAPTMTGDGMLQYKNVDIPMGEFWFRSPTHDKPNDLLDAVSGGHIYGKNIIQAEAFTELRLMWDEHPAMLKTLTDRSFASGINRFALHVNAHNPWIDRKPGMTLDGIGLFFQRDQTWWKAGRAWIEYIQRCQALLQQGRPIVDIAIFTGEEIPARAILPDRLIPFLPGIFGPDRIQQERERLLNKGIPMREVTEGYPCSANMADPENWVDPLKGYAYDSFNRDALLRLATFRNGRIELPGGASYGLLVIPGSRKMSLDGGLMSLEVIDKLLELAKAGATIMISEDARQSPGMQNDEKVKEKMVELLSNPDFKVIRAPYQDTNFDRLNIKRDVILKDVNENYAPDIAWNHRTGDDFDIYFISNQQARKRTISISLRKADYMPELWDALTAKTYLPIYWKVNDGRTELRLDMEANGSVFIVMRNKTDNTPLEIAKIGSPQDILELTNTWKVNFNSDFGGPGDTRTFSNYDDWSKQSENSIKYYSGTVTYTKEFEFRQIKNTEDIWLDFDHVANLAEVFVNEINCGVAWTAPYRVNIGNALRAGNNLLRIEVTNTWANRLIGDEQLPEEKRITWTNKSPVSMKNRPLLPAGILGKVKLVRMYP